MFRPFRKLTRGLTTLFSPTKRHFGRRLLVRGFQAVGLALLIGFSKQIYYTQTNNSLDTTQGLRDFDSTVVCDSKDIKQGAIFNVDLPNGRKVIIVRYKGRLHAVSGQCTYDNKSSLSEGVCFGDKLFCCEHGCAFDIETGRVEFPPALNDLPRFFVEERNGKVTLTTPRKMPISIQPLCEGRDYTDMRKVVIVGEGMGVLGCIEGLRQNGYSGEITVITSGSDYPFDDEVRTNNFWKKHKTTQSMSEATFPRPDSWYKDMGVNFIFNQEIADIDARQHYPFVMLQNEIKIEYDGLLLAIGTSPIVKKVPGLAKGGKTFILNSKNDYQNLSTSLANNNIKDLTILGYNLKSMSLIRTLKKEFPSINITVIDPNTKSNVEENLGPQLTLLLVEADARHNVSFFLRMPVERVDRQNDQLKISMKFNQHITTDAIVMFPNNEISNAISLQKSSRVELDMSSNGNIKTDSNCRTSNKQIFAAGRGTTVHYFFGDELVPCLNNRMAYQEGYTAAYNMLALNIPYHMVPFQTVKSIDREVKLVGYNALYDDVHVIGDIDKWDFVVLYSLTGFLVACATTPSQKRIAGIFEQALREESLPSIYGFIEGEWTFDKVEETIRKNKKAGCYKDAIDTIRESYKTNPRDILWMHRDMEGSGLRVPEEHQKKPLFLDKDGFVKEPSY